MYFSIVLGLVAGLGLFLYGMTLMGNGLQKAAGDRLKKIIGMLTSHRLLGVVVGALVTAVIQSSSATTVMVVGFVNAGLMQLNQAVGVIMGANVGTTITGHLVSFDLEAIAPVTVGIGVLMHMLSKNQRSKNYSEILIGFGILFIGMSYMKDALHPLREVQAFKDALINFGKNPLLGILMGFTLTMLVQSSSASIGILIALASQGMLPMESALPILYGDNIGTCTTALISSIGTNRNAQRAAVMHLIFNIIGTVLFSVFLNKPILGLVTHLDPTNIPRQIANTHTFFNLINVAIQLPFAGLIVKIAERVIPAEDSELALKSTKFLDLRMLSTPSFALNNTIKECIHMGETARYSFECSMQAFLEKNKDMANKTFDTEKKVNQLEKEIMEYLIQLSNAEISGVDRSIVDELFNTINDLERIGDHADNIAELAVSYIDRGLNFSEESIHDMKIMYDKVLQACNLTLEAMASGDAKTAKMAVDVENEVNMIEKSCRSGHIYRLNNNRCHPEEGIIFADLLSNMERISDHASNMARAIIDAKGNISVKGDLLV